MLSFGVSTETKNRLYETDIRVKGKLPVLENNKSVGKRLVEAFGTDDKEFIAKILGFKTVGGLYKVLSGERELDFVKLRIFRNHTKRTIDWLLTGELDGSSKMPDMNDALLAKLETVANEQARTIFSSAEVVSVERAQQRTVEILQAYLVSRGMQEYNLLPDDEFLMDKKDLRRAQQFSFVRDKAPSIEERFRQIVIDELKRNGVGKDIEDESDTVTMEQGEMILAPVVARISGAEEKEKLRKTG